MKNRQTAIDEAYNMQNALIARATGGDTAEFNYENARQYFLSTSTLADKIPGFIRQCHNLDQYWAFISSKFEKYKERRTYIWDEFKSLIEHLEASPESPLDEYVGNSLKEFNAHQVHTTWQKALARKTVDPEGAITVARTLLETVCKHILDEAGIPYTSKTDLPKLWSKCANHLNLSPSQHSEQAFRAILGSCHTIVQYLGTIRNQIGDAHGQGRNPVKPRPRHAELAVNVSGAMASFLVQTWNEREEQHANADAENTEH